MSKPYNAGSRDIALQLMAQCAIRDQEALIEALTPPRYMKISAETAKEIQDCRDWIEDFKRIDRQANAKYRKTL